MPDCPLVSVRPEHGFVIVVRDNPRSTRGPSRRRDKRMLLLADVASDADIRAVVMTDAGQRSVVEPGGAIRYAVAWAERLVASPRTGCARAKAP